MRNPLAQASRTLVALAASLSVAIQPLAVQADGFYYRSVTPGSGGYVNPTPGTSNPGGTPAPGTNDQVKGNGDLAVYSASSARARPGVPFGLSASAKDPSGSVQWASVGTQLPQGLALNASTGTISGTPSDGSVGTLSGIVLQGADSGGKKGTTQPITINVIARPGVTVAASTTVASGAAVSIVPSVSNALGSQTWAVNGALPAGLSFNAATGAISGSSRQGGTVSGLSLSVTDSDGAVGTSAPFSITVTSAMVVGGISDTYGARVNRAMTPIQPSLTGAKGAVVWTLATGTLPPGVSLDMGSGRISGTPTQTGTFSKISLQATDTTNGAVTLSPQFSMSVGTTPTVALSPLSYSVRFGKPIDIVPSVSGLVGSARWSIQGGTLPPGSSLDTSTGAVYVNSPSSVSLTGLTLKVIDLYDGSSSTTQPFSLTAYGAIKVAATSNQIAGIGQPFTLQPPAVSNLIGSPTWSLSGTLPAGLAFNPATGVISGTPTTPTGGGLLLTYSVKDSQDGATGSGEIFNINVPPPGTVAVTGVSSSYVAYTGKAFSLVPGSIGAKAPSFWTVTSLPSWAAFDTGTGAITGTPGAPEGQASVQLTLQDSANKTASSPAFTLSTLAALSVAYGPASVGQGSPVTLDPSVSGASGPVTYSMSKGTLPDGLGLDPQTGRISGTTFTAGSSTYAVAANDGVMTAVSNSFAISVSQSPYSASIPASPGGQPGVPFSVQASASGFGGAVTWSVVSGTLPSWAQLTASTGVVAGTPPSANAFGPFVLEASDGTGARARTNPFSVLVTQNPVLTAKAQNVSVAVNAPLTLTGQVTNSQGAVTWSLDAGTLPAGLALNAATGTISGTPTAPGVASGLVLKATDSVSSAKTDPFSITVTATPALQASVGNTAFPGIVGSTFATPAVNVSNALDGFTVALTSGTLPSWAKLDAATGSITGTPTGIASVGTTAGLRLTVTDGQGRTAQSQTFSISVTRKALTASGATGTTLRQGTPYTGPAPLAANQIGTVSWSVTPALPAGLSVNASTGVISGTLGAAPPGSAEYVLTATDSADASQASAGTFQVTVLGTPVVNVPASNNMRYGVSNALRPTATQVAQPLTWSLAAGTLPPGLSFDPATGTISGTPTTLGTTDGLKVSVKDAQGGTGTSAAFSIAVTNTITAGFAQVPYPAPPQRVTVGWTSPAPVVNGPIGKVTYELASGTLPPGFSFSATTGQITGTSTAAFSGSVRIKATDSTGQTATTPSLDVSMGPAAAVTMADLNVRIGAPLLVAPGVQYAVPSPNTGTYGMTIAGSLPAGLGLGFAVKNSYTYYVSGTPTATASVSGLVLTVTDWDGAVGSSAPFSVTVTPGITVSGLQASYTGRAGVPFATAIQPSVGNAKGTVTWSANVVPPGLSLDTATGKVSGTPTAAYTGPVTLVATDDFDGAKASATASVSIAPAVQVLGTSDLTVHAGVNSATAAPSVVGQKGTSMAWSSVGTALPPYASLNGSTGIISLANPTVGATSGIRLLAQDSADSATGTSTPFSITVVPYPAVANVSTSYTARLGFPFRSAAPSLSNAIGSVAWSVGAGALPPWAQLNADGSISGTPTGQVAGTTSGLKLTGTDSTNASASSAAFTLGVYAQPAVTLASSNATGQMRVGDAITLTPGVSGLAGSPTWRVDVSSGALPAGLAMADPATGIVSGTATVAGAATFALTVTDSADGSSSSSPSTSLTVNPAMAMAQVQDYTVHANDTFISTPANLASGLVGTVSYAISPGIPAGMNPFDTATGVLSGVPSSPGTGKYTITAKDSFDGRTAATSFSVTVADALAFSVQPTDVTPVLGSTVAMTVKAVNGLGNVAYALYQNGSAAPTALSSCTGLSFSTATGAITGTAGAVCSVTGLSVVATDTTQTATSAQFKVATAAANVTGNDTLAFQEGSAGIYEAFTNLESPTWSLTGAPPYATVSTNGLVTVYGADVTSDQTTNVTVKATSGPYSASKTFAMKVTAASASVSTPQVVRAGGAIRNASVGTNMSAAGTWTATSTPADVTGLTVANNAVVGTAPNVTGTAAATRTLTVTYTGTGAPSGATAAVASASAVLTVQPHLTATMAAITGNAGNALAANVPTVNNRIGTLSYALFNGSTDISATLGQSCAGLSFSSVSGSVTGTPTAACSVAGLTLKVHDDGNNNADLADDATAPLSITINPATATVAQTTASPVYEGAPVAFTSATTLNSPTYAFDTALVTPPAWLAIDPATGAVSGNAPDIAADQSYSFAVKATSGAFSVSSAVSNFTVKAASVALSAPTTVAAGGSTSSNVTSTFTSGLTYAFAAYGPDGTTPASDVTFSPVSGGVVTINAASSANTTNANVTRFIAVTATSTSAPSSGAAATATSTKVQLTVAPNLAISMASQALALNSTATLSPTVTGLTGTGTYALLQNGTSTPNALASCGYTFSTATGQMTTTGATACNVAGLAIKVTSSDGPTATSSPTFSVIVSSSSVPLAAVTPPTGNGSFAALTYSSAPVGGDTTYKAFFDGKDSTYSATLGASQSQRIAYYYNSNGIQTDCFVVKGAATGGNGTLTAILYLGQNTAGSITGNVVSGQYTQAVASSPIAKSDSMAIMAGSGTVSISEFRFGNMSGGVCVQPGTGGTSTNMAFTANPQSLSLAPGSTASTTASLSGTPNGNLTWAIVDPQGAAIPTWLTLNGCGGNSMSCTVSAAPTYAANSGVSYPTTGTYTLTATDSTGVLLKSTGFSVALTVPLASNTPPNSRKDSTNNAIAQYYAPVVTTAAPNGTSYAPMVDGSDSTSYPIGTSTRVAYFWDYSAVQSDCMVVRGTGGGSVQAATRFFLGATLLTSAITGTITSGQTTQITFPSMKFDSMDIMTKSGTTNLSEFRFGNMQNGVCQQSGTGSITYANLSYSQQPASALTAGVGATAVSTSGTLSGAPAGTLAWSVIDASNNAAPSWVTTSNCGTGANASCTVNVAPTTSTATGTYTYYLTATDTSNGVQYRSNAIAITVTPSINQARPTGMYYSQNATASCQDGAANCTPLSVNAMWDGTVNPPVTVNNGESYEVAFAGPVNIGSMAFRLTDKCYTTCTFSLQYWTGSAWASAGTPPAYWSGSTINSAINASSTYPTGSIYASRWRMILSGNASNNATLYSLKFGNASSQYAP